MSKVHFLSGPKCSPSPLVVTYPYLKRVTPLAHFGVGLALALAPLGAHVAVTGTLKGAAPVLLLALFTLLWVAGFDILYACQDLAFDRAQGLRSIPARYGVPASLTISRGLHVVTTMALATIAWVTPLGQGYLLGVVGVGTLLAYEQSLVRVNDLSRVKQAFDLNGYVGLFYLVATATALYVE